jgi:hypothetical protein
MIAAPAARHQHRLRHVDLRLHGVVEDGERGDGVDDAVEAVPADGAEALDHAVGRGEAEGE